MAHERIAARASREEVQVNMEIGRRIEELRKARGHKQAKFAHVAQISPQRLYSYEVGRCPCPPAVLARIAYILVVDLADLVPEYKPVV